ncbi:TetR/AcrR family transcriptional regulator [Actinomadura alba]|uniref:TetR/AcrR family transcriptional regulator n=1 Tax=Actinomadura alba TaxID=406431 RepID=A0ABR7LZK3_9ACTN|nr:TetR/AcrR family transcriptional regulator [Actinomadura alba]MBC6470190.1 TetR/AcrR family transcriptional regulator [Actinomadura alba]
MARKSSSRPSVSAWQWSRTAETRRGILGAAREVFAERGFAEASVADVVERSGSSVGSLYHHFGGKAELFLALYEGHQNAHEEDASAAVSAMRESGESNPLELFIAGARAFLEGSWERRDLVRLFMDCDGPPGFELMRRTRNREWVRQNAVLLGAGSGPVGRATVAMLTTVIGEAGREIAACENKIEADTVTAVTLRLIRRLDPLTAGDEV